jgi:biotin operon repressor
MRYTMVLHELLSKFELSWEEYVVADTVHIFSSNPNNLVAPGWYYGSKDYLVELVKISRSSVFRHIASLIEKGILEKDNKGQLIRTTQLWNAEVFNVRGLAEGTDFKKEDKPTEKKTEVKYPEESMEYKAALHLYNLILQNIPTFKTPDLQGWAKHVDLMFRVDKRSAWHLRQVMEWCQAHSFWKPNILSTKKLREKYDTLTAQMNAEIKKPTIENDENLNPNR